MIIIQMMGGLGNQLQQYAFYMKLNKCGIDAKIDTSWYSSDIQENMAAPRTLEIKRLKGVSFEEADAKEVSKLLGSVGAAGLGSEKRIGKIIEKARRKFLPWTIHVFEENSRIFVPEIYDGVLIERNIRDLYTKAHFACEYYYADILEELREEISFPIEEAIDYQGIVDLSEEMMSTNSVSVHIRRGDYLDDLNMKYYGGICTEEYYEAAVKYIIEKTGADRFYIFSDDIAYAEDFACHLIGIDVNGLDLKARVVDINHGVDNMFDIYLMSRCKHNITANSTFSFWGARFNGNEKKIMIRPTKHINQQPFDAEDMKIWWKGWTLISPEGVIFPG